MNLQHPYRIVIFEGQETLDALTRIMNKPVKLSLLRGSIEEVAQEEFKERLMRGPVVLDRDYSVLYLYPQSPIFGEPEK